MEVAFGVLGLDWQKYVVVDENFFRPLEVYALLANPEKAKKKLGWEPKTKFDDLVKIMVEDDLGGARPKIMCPKRFLF